MNHFLKVSSNYKGTYPLVGKLFIAGSFLALAMSGYSWIQSGVAQREL